MTMENKTNTTTQNTASLRQKYSAFLNKPGIHGTLRFYCILLGVILAALVLLCCLMIPMSTILEQYEASRPKHMAAEVYKMLFEEPDWAVIYNLSEEEGTEFEGRSSYVNYMSQKVGSKTLTYRQVPGGLSGSRRYCVRLGNEPVAYFTLVSVDDGVSTFPYWILDDVELCAEGTQTVTVTVQPGSTVYINGVALDERHIVSTVSTPAEDHLPSGLHGYRYVQMQVTGLMTQPDVVALDEYGTVITLTRTGNGTYTADIPVSTVQITEDEASLVVNALNAEALFSINAITAGQLREFFDPNGQAYEDMLSHDMEIPDYYSYEFDTSSVIVDQYWRYSDTVFSARATGTLNLTDYSGVTTSIPVCYSYMFTQNYNGDYVVSGRTEDDMLRHDTAFRVNYSDGVNIVCTQLEPAIGALNAPSTVGISNARPTSWAVQAEDGTMTTVIVLLQDGSYAWADGVAPTSVTVYPVFD